MRVRCSGKNLSSGLGLSRQMQRGTQLLELPSSGHQAPGGTHWLSGKKQSSAILGTGEELIGLNTPTPLELMVPGNSEVPSPRLQS